MADVRGPYQNQTAVRTPTLDTIEASESQPAVFYCSYICHDHSLNYIYWLYVDVLLNITMPAGFLIKRETEFLDREPYEVKEYNFTVTSSQINLCNQASNVTTYKIQISVGEETPTLIPKCVIEYNRKLCSNLNAFIVIPSTGDITTVTPSEPTIISDTSERCIPQAAGIGVLGILFTIETAILMALLLIWLFYRCKFHKTQVANDDGVYNSSMKGESNIVESRAVAKSKNKTTHTHTPVHAIPNQTLDIPNLAQDNDR